MRGGGLLHIVDGHAHILQRCSGRNDDGAHHVLHRHKLGVRQVHHAGEPRIPEGNSVEHGDGGDGWQAQRQDHADQDGKLIGAVQIRGLLQCVRNGIEEVAHDQHVPGVADIGQHQRPPAVEQAQFLHQNVVGHHAAGEQHGKEHHAQDAVAAAQLALAEGVGQGNRQEHAQRRAHDDHKQRVGITSIQLIGLKKNTVSRSIPNLRPEDELAAPGNLRRADKGGDQHAQQRHNGDHRQQAQQDIRYDNKDSFASRDVFHSLPDPLLPHFLGDKVGAKHHHQRDDGFEHVDGR